MTSTDDTPLDSDQEPTPTEAPAGGRGMGLMLLAGGLVVVIAVALLSIVSGDDTPDGEIALDNLVFINEDGTEGSLADFQGAEPIVVNFYASWCAPCRAELPDFDEVHVAGDGRVQFLGINHDIDESSWRAFGNEIELSYPTVFQPEQEIWENLDLFGMPATVFITPDGEVVHTVSGVLDQDSLKQLIAEHLQVEV